jgi:hypothetical protein
MNLNDLLRNKDIEPANVLVFRHRPKEPKLNKIFPFLVAERPDLFRVYEQVQTLKVERAMAKMVGQGYVASFMAHGPGRALFIGLTKIAGSKAITKSDYWKNAKNQELKSLGMSGLGSDRSSVMLFDLKPVTFYPEWKGKLIVDWPPPERSWWRRAGRNRITVHAVLEESALAGPIKMWNVIDFAWAELQMLPACYRATLSEWRAIYYIFDTSDGKGYVGAACGNQNLLGRWLNYAESGHGGNRLLRQRNPQNFRFTILERVSPDMVIEEVVRLETTWKERLHSRKPYGLNIN